jgi:hypothetical protein
VWRQISGWVVLAGGTSLRVPSQHRVSGGETLCPSSGLSSFYYKATAPLD